MRRLWCVAAALALPWLSGCAVGPDFKPPSPAAPAGWSALAAPPGRQASQASPAAGDLGAWWANFSDPELTSLVSRAAAANLDVREAVLRIAEARAQRDLAAAAAWPDVGLNASAETNRVSEATPTGALISNIGHLPGLSGVSVSNPYWQYQLGFDASWEVDLFGRVRRSMEAANANTAASLEDSRAVLVATLGDVASAYLDLRDAQAKRDVVSANIATERQLLDLAAQRRRTGLNTEIDVTRAAAEVSNSEAQLPLLDRQIQQDVNRLSRLLALQPGSLKAELERTAPVPPTPPVVPVGLPAELVRRRPDIRAAEDRLHAATAEIGVAVADLFPRVTLNAAGGYQSETFAKLTNWASRFLTAGPAIELPIFDAGQRRAVIRLQEARQKEAAVDYARTVLSALHEVDDALIAYGQDQTRRDALARTVARDRTALGFARQRYAAGVGDFIDVLDADRSLQQGEIQLTDAQALVSEDLVALYRALGGGWG